MAPTSLTLHSPHLSFAAHLTHPSPHPPLTSSLFTPFTRPPSPLPSSLTLLPSPLTSRTLQLHLQRLHDHLANFPPRRPALLPTRLLHLPLRSHQRHRSPSGRHRRRGVGASHHLPDSGPRHLAGTSLRRDSLQGLARYISLSAFQLSPTISDYLRLFVSPLLTFHARHLPPLPSTRIWQSLPSSSPFHSL